MELAVAHWLPTRLATAALVAAVVSILCGCRKPPDAQQLVGIWASTDKVYTIDLRADGTYAYSVNGGNRAKTGSAEQIGLDFFDLMRREWIGTSGQWQVDEGVLRLTGEKSPDRVPQRFKIVSWSDDSLALEFVGNQAPVCFERRKP